MKKTSFTLGLCTIAIVTVLIVAQSAFAASIGLNPASPLSGFALGGGQYATLVGVQNGFSVGDTITVADLNAAILSGSVLGWYYASGNTVSSKFANISLYASFVSDTVAAGTNPSYAASHNGTGGTTTMSTWGTRVQENPFVATPEPGSTIPLMATGLCGLLAAHRRLGG